MTASTSPGAIAAKTGVWVYFALACAITWLFATPVALAWMSHQAPAPYAVACAGLSAFGPLFAAIAVAAPKKQLGAVFGRWRTNPGWVVLALLAPLVIHTVATALYVVVGGHPAQWFHPPTAPEQLAALVVFPLGEEFGWRGFAHPRLVERFGLTKGSLILGFVWSLWHLVYSITPDAAAFDLFTFGQTLVELSLYSLLVAWVFERSNRSMAVAIAFHAGAHLDHIEHAPRSELGLHALHVLVLLVFAALVVRSFARSTALQPAR